MRWVVLLLATLPLAPLPLRAQAAPSAGTPSWLGDASTLALNSFLGAVTGGTVQALRGGSFSDGFTRGALGGAIVYAGKRLAVQALPGSGVAGRAVAGAGSSIVRNASDGLPSLSRVVLPLGPARLYLRDGATPQIRWDAATLVAAGYAFAEPKLHLDWGATLSSGAPVFRVRDQLLQEPGGAGDAGASGTTRAGTIYLSDIEGLDYNQDLRHERIHVVQNDFVFLGWTDPVEDALLHAIPGGAAVARHVDLNLSVAVTSGLALAFRNYHRRPWEVEARALAER